jgi:GNAT superfamily N-acetyltransferase
VTASNVNVRLATEADQPALARVLGRAFDDDPVMNFVISGRPVAPRAELLLGLFATMHLADQSVYVAEDPETGEILGGAVWAPPGHWRVPMLQYVKHLRTLLKAVGIRSVTKISVLNAMEKHHPKDLHHYLAVIGTDPRHQGKGVGKALMAPVLATCDLDGVPAYLESSKESNVGYYERFEFATTLPFTLKGGPTMYFMWREPQVPDED